MSQRAFGEVLEPLTLTAAESAATVEEVDVAFAMVCSLINAMSARRQEKSPMMQTAMNAIHCAVLKTVLEAMPERFDRRGAQELFDNTTRAIRLKMCAEA